MSTNEQINCPNCGTNIDVTNIISHQLEAELQAKFQAQLNTERSKMNELEAKLRDEKMAFEEKKKRENELFHERLEKSMMEERVKLEEKIKIKITEEQLAQFDALQKELNEKSAQVSELNKTKAEVERLKREKEEAQSIAQLAAETKMNEMLQIEKEKIKKLVEDSNEMRIRDLQKKLEDQKNLTEEMIRKQEQGSMQLQGEVQELAIEEWLANQFPLDTIEEIKKGARGGDCIQIVHTRSEQNCGKIYYESKRTKDFQAGWIAKFKADMREKGADVGVLVTEAMPSDLDRMGLKDGVYVCTYEEFKGLSGVLRETVIQVHAAQGSQVNRGDKMHMLYDFLTSASFRMQVEAIVEGFTSMKDGLESEKRSMQRIWKEREKQIEKVIINTIDMHASIRGIAGNAIQSVKALELPGEHDDEIGE
ncbi:MAG: DUF2130 domain-containing protein [Crocinitomicaceae bacterium]|jgi:hypothetical protein|nr:DUF2130 domain-containing protein [Crocinitomicaceae bacterium]MDP4761177.1 DUF2130 domain-containing protein [Crocinitomicaceae bacterium]